MILISLLAAAAPVSADTAVGRWKTETHDAIIEIQRCGPSICGRILTSDALRTDPAMRDSKNPDAALRNRPIRGMQILSGFTADGNGWSGGKLYKADEGKTYSGKLTVTGPNEIKVRGCIFVPLCKTQTWTRVR